MPARPAPPTLDAVQAEARALLRAHRAGDPEAIARVAREVPAAPAKVTLATARQAVARELGFPSWRRLRAYLTRLATGGPELQHPFREEPGYYADRAEGLRASAEDGTPSAVAPFARWGQPVDRQGARAVVARQHGFGSWAALRRGVGALRESGEPFARAFRAVEARDVGSVAAVLDRFPHLVAATGTNGNDLLGMATATGSEPLVRLLLERGADPAGANAHGWTALHQAGYMDAPGAARILLEAGAPVGVSGRGDGGTPLVAALFWGHRRVVEVLAPAGALPRNLRVAAGLGDLGLLDELLTPDGRLAPEAGAHRAFYRPHSGFPPWRPGDDPQEVIDEALSWAARGGRLEAMDRLVARGASVDAEVYRGTALAWAAASGRTDAVRRLLALGADPDRRTGFGGPDHGDGATALHLAAEGGRLEVIVALLEAGADPTIRERRYGGTPADWAEHFGDARARELLAGRDG
jgi:ankyrin repeat protein